MAKFYIQLQGKLVPVGKITEEDIKEALGVEQLFNFSGNFYELDNNPFKDESNGELKIVDPEGRIIAIVDKDGIHSIEMTAIKSGITHNLTEKMDVSEFESIITVDESGKFVIEDENGNEGLKLDSTGLYVKDVTAGKHVLSQKADLDDIDFNNLVDNPIYIDDTGEFVIEDESGNKGFILNKSGVEAKNFTTSDGASLNDIGDRVNSIQDKVDSINEMISDDEEDRLIIRDGDGEVGLELNKDGLYVKDVTAGKNVLSQKADLDIVNKKLDKSEFTEIITVDETGEFVIEDEKGNEGLKLNSGGLTVINDVITLNEKGEEEHKLSKKADLNDVNSLRTDIGETIKDIESNVSKNKEDITNLSTNVNNITERIDVVEGRVDANESNITNLSNTVNSNKSQINSIQGEVDSINEMISDAEESSFIVSDSNDYIGLKLDQEGLYVKDVITLNEKGEEEHRLSKKANQSDLNTLTSNVELNKKNIDKKLDKSTFEEVINTGTSDTVKVLYDGENEGLTVNASGISTSGDVIADGHKLKEKANQSDLEGVYRRLSDIETLLDEDSDDIINNIRDVIDYFKNVSESEVGEAFINSVSENTDNIKKNADGIKQLSEDVDTLEGSVNGRIDGLNNTIDKLDKEVDSLNGVVNTNVTNITNLTSTVNTHTSNIKAINDNISLIEDDVDTINDMVSDAEESSFIVSDSNDYIGLKLDQEGLHVNKDVITYTKDGEKEHVLSKKANQSDVDAISVITSASASVDSSVGTPSVTVSLTGDDVKNKTLNFEFKNLKGENGEIGYGIFYTNTEYNSDTTSIIKSDIIDNVRTIQVGDLVLSSNGNIFSVKEIGYNLTVEYLTSIKGSRGVRGASVASISVVGNLEHGSGKTNTYELTDSDGKILIGDIEVKDGFDGIGIKDITKKDSSDSDSDLVDTYTITYTDDEKEPYDFYVTNGKDGHSIFYTSSPFYKNTAGIIYTYINTYGRTIQVGDLILSSNGNIFSVKGIGSPLSFVVVEYLTSIKGVEGASVSSIVCVDGDNSENLADVNNEDGAINYYRIKDNNNNFLEGTIAIKNGSSDSGDSDSDVEDIDIPFEEDESGEFVIIDDSAEENIGLILDSEGVAAKDFFTSSDVSLNDVGDRLSVVEDSIGIELITYDNLVQLRNDKLLIPGKKYRITDYRTTTTQENTLSAGHKFDIIVTADTVNILNENARACLHDGDTYFSNAGANLEAWQIWYCLDNDKDRFAWADTNNGKGVIYRMIDAWGNDLPYDFKNIQFKRHILNQNDAVATNVAKDGDLELVKDKLQEMCYQIHTCLWYYGSFISDVYPDAEPESKYVPFVGDIYYVKNGPSVLCKIGEGTFENFEYFYTFHNVGGDASLSKPNKEENVGVWDNVIKNNNSAIHVTYEGRFEHCIYNNQYLNDIVLYGNTCYSNIFGNDCYSNTFGNYFNSNTFGTSCGNNTFGKYCHSNTFGNHCHSNTFGNHCSSNTFANECFSNTLGNTCYSNTFGYQCHDNTFGTDCYYNTLGNSYHSNTLGDFCYSNAFGDSCSSNTFGNRCYFNTFGNRCQSNTFGNECYSNTLGDSCNFNKFGNNCQSNTFGINCQSNKFANRCYSNTFCNNCQSNTFDDDCCYNTFGDDCLSNKFDTNCSFNKFGYSCTSNTFCDNCYSNTFDNYCYSNTFGYSCYGNTFGNNCNCNTFGSSKSSPSSYYRYIIFDNANCYINLNCTSTTSSSNFYQNVRIGLGVNNNTTTYKTIDDTNTNQTFETLYIPENSQTIKI